MHLDSSTEDSSIKFSFQKSPKRQGKIFNDIEELPYKMLKTGKAKGIKIEVQKIHNLKEKLPILRT